MIDRLLFMFIWCRKIPTQLLILSDNLYNYLEALFKTKLKDRKISFEDFSHVYQYEQVECIFPLFSVI